MLFGSESNAGRILGVLLSESHVTVVRDVKILSLYCSKYALFPFYGFGIRRNCSGRNGKLGGRLSPVTSEIPSEILCLRNLEVLDLEKDIQLQVFSGGDSWVTKLHFLNHGLNSIFTFAILGFTDLEFLQEIRLKVQF